MTSTRTRLFASAAVFSGLAYAAGAPASPGELTILSGGAAKSGLTPVIQQYEAKAGAKVKAEFQPMGKLTRMLADGAKPDIVVATSDVLPDIAAKGHVLPDTAVELGRVGVGVAVKDGAPLPDISTPEALKAALLAARSIIMINPATGTSGKHLAQVFADLGIADALKPKTTYLDGGYVVEPVGRGEIELGLHQITEILPVAGVRLVGPLPPSLQKVTVYVAAVGKDAPNKEAAQRFLEQLKSPDARAVIAAKGYTSGP
jgi:molybdate transport system substrate-binding protein